MTKKQKLELTWVGKENRPRLEPRILIEDPAKSYHAAARVTDNDIFDNVLIHGDNLLALKALEAEYAGKVKCVFIDPPYNTKSAFGDFYDDGLEHSIWLGLIRDRLEIIRRLLSDDGSLWITIDDNEAHYLKVLCDEIFGRPNFVASAVWQKRYSRENREAIVQIRCMKLLLLEVPFMCRPKVAVGQQLNQNSRNSSLMDESISAKMETVNLIQSDFLMKSKVWCLGLGGRMKK